MKKTSDIKIIYLGQAGFYLELDNRIVLIDPYLSNNVAKYQPQNERRQPIDEHYLSVKPDIILITHAHLDHYDEETLKHYLGEKTKVTLVGPKSVYEKAISFGGKNKYVELNSGEELKLGNLVIKATYAEHTDKYAVGFCLSYNNKNYLFTGDTMLSNKVIESVPKQKYEYVMLPINGVGNNMNSDEAIQFLDNIDYNYAIPIHIGMFDNIKGSILKTKKKIIPTIYKEIEK